jgi:aminoglycoside phosphotransferase (APT) family kinase protein
VVDLDPTGGGSDRCVLQVATTEGTGPGMAGEAELLRRAATAGVPVPTVLAAGEDERLGGAYLVTDFLAGETIPKRVLTEPALADGRRSLTQQAAEALVGIHGLRDGLPKLVTLSDPVGVYRATLDQTLDPRPTLELVYRWLDEHRPKIAEPSIVHGDFRMGNLMVDRTGLRAVLDWELAHLGDPMEDVAWPIIRAWRFDRHRAPGDFPDRDRWLDAYEAASGRALDRDAVRWWEVAGTFKWAVICLSQARRHLDGSIPSLELAAIGRRVVESEYDLLRLLDVDVPAPTAADDAVAPGVHGRPTASELTAAIHDLLRGPLAAEVGGAARHQLRVAANAVGIVDRELRLGAAQERSHRERLATLDVTDDASLSTAIRTGRQSATPGLWAVVAADVADRLAVANPSWFEDAAR